MGLLILDVDDRQHRALRAEAAGDALDVGRGIHVDAERFLRLADFDFRSPISHARARRRAGFDVKDVADFLGERADVGEVFALLHRDAIGRDRDVDQDARDDQRDDAEESVFREDEPDARFGRHGREREPAEVDVIHHPAQVLASDREDGMRGSAPGRIS